MKLVYEYPPKLSKTGRQAKAIHDLNEHKKMSRTMYKNLTLGIVIIAIGFIVPVALFKALLIFMGVANAAMALLIYWFYALSRSADVYTKVYDDHVEHSQRVMFTKDYLNIVLYYDEVERSYQNSKGKLICLLKNTEKSSFMIKKKNGKTSEWKPEGHKLVLSFQDTQAKLVIVNDFYDKINYPHKKYKVIDDCDDDYYSDEDLKWDRLKKHGL